MQLETLKSLYKTFKERRLFGRYIHTKNIEPIMEDLPGILKIDSIGKSVNNENIFSITVGNGKKKILLWSQMHGNESTSTKALFDILNVLCDSNEFSGTILSNCTLMIIPILNPDGAAVYTRLNSNNIDLNRDAQHLSQPESIVLRKCFDDFKPDYCLNLHGQRTIFSVDKSNNPATVSFLAPAQDANCSITANRKIAMEIISVMNAVLQKQIPNQIGIYDDAFNINCVGDAFQSQNVPTILFEAGHYNNDYKREQTREYMFQSLFTALHYIAVNNINGNHYKSYFDIPKNEKYFFDIIIRNAVVKVENKEQQSDIGILYSEKLIGNVIEFIPTVNKISSLNKYFGHKEINANYKKVLSSDSCELKIGYENDFVLINNKEFSLKLKNT